MIAKGDARKLPLPDKSVDLVFGSPPYCDARTYGIGAQRSCTAWVEWMLGVTNEAVRVSRGLTLWVCSGVTRDWRYQPACEGLLWEWYRMGGACWRPAYWHRSGIPGSGGSKWLRSDVEYVLAFVDGSHDFWTDNTACGKAPQWKPGGNFTNRMKDGRRSDREYSPPWKANPGNLISVPAGGGKLGSGLAHENEAPFPEKLAEFFVSSFCPPGGITLDPFSGSGTTAVVSESLGRRGIGIDIRESQCELGVQRTNRWSGKTTKNAYNPLPNQMNLF